MNPPFYLHILQFPYASWIYAYFSCNLLTPRTKRAHPMRMLFLIGLVLIPFIGIFRVFHRVAGTNLLNIYFVVMTILFFRDKLWIKLASYIVFMIISVLIEICSCSIFLLIQEFVFHVSMTVTEINSITEIPDILLMSGISISLGLLVYWKVTLLLKRCMASLNAKIVFLIMLPIMAAILSNIAVIRAGSSHSVFLAAVYWVLCLASYPAFLVGLADIRKAEKRRVLKEQQMKLLKEQLELSQKMEAEYTDLRRWNHDVENHLLSLSYLMDTEKYTEADEYRTTMMEGFS